MDSQKIKLIITLALIPLMVLLFMKNLSSGKKKRRKPAAKAAQAAVSPETKSAAVSGILPEPAVTTSEELSAQAQRAALDWGRNPFARAAQEKKYTHATLELRGVSVSREKGAYAYINDEIVTVGDIIAEYEVCEIEKNRVKLERRGESFYLVLPEE